MEELEGKINALFSSPESMERILSLARTLSGSTGNGENTAAASDTDAGTREDTGEESRDSDGLFSGLGDLDPRILQAALGAFREFSKPSETSALLNAIIPYLAPGKAEKVERAMNIAKLARIARKVIPEFGGV